jgi:uncharacterized integral membrane protein (TIGR00697 family)
VAERTRQQSTSTAGYYPVVSAVFVALLVISNVGAVKLISVGPLIVDGGAFLFPLVYITGDVLSEVYGFAAARRTILTGFAMAVLAALTFWAVQESPPAAGWENQSAYQAILGFVPRIVLASVTGFLVGQLINAWTLVWIGKRTRGRALWLRLIGSTIFGELADTLLFCTIAFYGVLTGLDFLNYVAVGYIYKTLLEVALLPITYRVIAAISRREADYRGSAADLAR